MFVFYNFLIDGKVLEILKKNFSKKHFPRKHLFSKKNLYFFLTYTITFRTPPLSRGMMTLDTTIPSNIFPKK